MSGWTESQVIEAISRRFSAKTDLLIRGIGDDCAVLRDGCHLVSTDASIEGVHFNLDWMSLADGAYRCLTSNISDVGAMGTKPLAWTLALGLRPDISFSDIQAAIDAFDQCLKDHGLSMCPLIGGDVVRSPSVMFSVTIFAPKPSWPLVYRHTARPGDIILALGRLGYSAAGLALFEAGYSRDQIDALSLKPLRVAFVRPHALPHLASQIAQNRLATAMMDISDGIRTDLPRLLSQSSCGAVVDVDRLHPDPVQCRAAQVLSCDARDWMVCGGEDFGLLLTCKNDHLAAIEALCLDHGVSCTRLGTCTDALTIEWLDRGQAYMHQDSSFHHF